MISRWIAAWLALLVLAVLNGVLREAIRLPYLLSGLILSALVLVVAVALAPWLRLSSPKRALAAGALWLALTLVFEFGFGLVQGRSWLEMLDQYTFRDGNIWPLVLAVVLLAPLTGWRLRERNAVSVPRRIVGFHPDEEGHWVADLECGHGQHVRHTPPWQERPWVVTPEGRAAHIGRTLNCVKCVAPKP